MATTSNFGWETPDDTDLVKDGAAAMRTLGNSIDTSFVDLKGGTTGQILSKASATDLDYTWITNDIGDITAVTAGTGLSGGGTSGAVTLAIDSTVTTLTGTQTLTNKTLTSPVLTTPSISNIDAKGDLLAGTADNTISRLAVGTNGQFLTADSAEATGLKWTTSASGGMTLINTGGTTLTGASVTVGSIPSTYTDLYIVVRNWKPSTDATNLSMAINGDTAANRYKSDYWNDGGSSTYTFDSSIYTMNYYQDNVTATGLTIAEIYDYANSATMKLIWNFGVNNNADTPSTSIQTWKRSGWYSQTTAISSLVFSCSSGNLNGGTVFVYGVK